MNKYLLYKIILPLAICACCMNISAQVLPPAYTSGATINYVRTWSVQKPMTDGNVVSASTNLQEVTQATQYIDGIGRPLQTVVRGVTPLAKDMVAPVIYDQYGREQNKYLGYVSPGADGSFKTDPFLEQKNFYADANTNSPVKGQGETYYYGQTQFEASPLNRVAKTLAPGNSWNAAGRGVSMSYDVNAASEVRIWNISFTPGAVPTSTGYYAAGLLYRKVTADERGYRTVEYKDIEGHLLLKKVEVVAPANITVHSGWLCTYYVYDDFNNLRFVIPPKATALVVASGNIDATTSAELCFRYEYDSRNRMIVKKVPGAGAVSMVYDARDRLVMTQDGNFALAPAKWMVMEYDALNRPIKTGLLTDANTATYHQGLASVSIAYPNTSGGNYELLSQTYYDDYSWVATSGSPFANNLSPSETWTGFLAASNTIFPYPQTIVEQASTKGLVTGSKVKIIGSSPVVYLYSVSYYDDRNRVIQSQATNITGGRDYSTSQYTFDGKLLINKITHTKAGGTVQTYILITTNTYDAAGRLLNTMKNINSTGNKTVLTNTYDEIGQLKTKKLAAEYNSGAGLETLTYDYNIRGWMLGENRNYAKTAASTSNYFGFDLGYDKVSIAPTGGGSIGTYAIPVYNGNVEGTVWKSKGDGEIRKYDFKYDPANRLLKADFNQYTSGTFNKNANVDFSVKMGDGAIPSSAYDANGNIISMTQNGLTLNTSPIIDQLTYTYTANSNKLSKVMDAIGIDNKLGDFNDGTSGSGTDYNYDANGNLNLDNNKAISGITYNHLNLPWVITVTGKGTITYTYDAAGNKLKKVTQENNATVFYNNVNNTTNITTTTSYISGFVYETKVYSNPALITLQYIDVLQFTAQEEGRIRRKIDGTFAFDYFLKDHLGNVRMVLTDNIQTDIYPAASLEASNVALEQNYYNITSGQIFDKMVVTGLPAYVNHNIIPNNPVNPTFDNANSAKLYKLNKNTQNIGLGITLKVMTGDKLDIYGKSYYFQNNTGGTVANTAVTTLQLLTGFLGGPTGAAAHVHGPLVAPQLDGIPATTGLINTLLGNQTTTNNATPQVPKAFINYILFDEQFKCVATGYAPLGANSVLTDYGTNPALHNIPVTKNGFVYIYCSNESPVDVFFDNLQVMHTRDAILEETSYYPFGLTMAGISSKAAGELQNKEKTFQGQRFDDDLGLNWVQFKWRNHDPQIGRFIEIDPLSDKYVYNSTYAFSEDKVTSHVELEGLEAEPIINKAKTELAENFQALANWFDNAISYVTGNSTSTEVSSTPISTTSVGSTTTNTASTNFGGNMNYIIAHNSNDGNPEPITKTVTKTTADQTTEIKTPAGTITNKTSVDNNGVVTQTTGGKGNINVKGVPVTVSGSVGKGTDGKSTMTLQGAAGTTNIKGVANAQYSTDGKKQSVTVGGGVQEKLGKTTNTSTIGIKIGW